MSLELMYMLIQKCLAKTCSNLPNSYKFGDTWESVQFPEGYEKPPKDVFEAKLQELIKNYPYDLLREERNRYLQSTDYLMVHDFPYPSEEIRTSWVTYRQKLRDLPTTTSPTLDEDDKLIVAWPTTPVWPVNMI